MRPIVCRRLSGLVLWMILGSASCAVRDAPATTDGGLGADSGILAVEAFDPATGESLPLNVILEGVRGTPDPSWRAGPGRQAEAGISLERGTWLAGHAAVGAFGQVALPLSPGRYDVTVSAGPERVLHQESVRLRAGEMVTVNAPLPRAVSSPGYACADLHVHSAPSFDSAVPLEARIASALAEGLDVLAPTDHDMVADWSAADLDLDVDDRLHVLLGGEISPGVLDTPPKGNFNVMPLPADVDMLSLFPHPMLTVQEIVSAAHALAWDPLVQLNHPRFGRDLGYFDLIDFDPLSAMGRSMSLAHGFDAIEVWNGHELDLPDGGVGLMQNLEDWFGLLRHGELMVGTGNSDSHRLARTPVGYPRTRVRVADDRASAITDASFIDALRGGDVFVTSGIFLDVSAEHVRPGATLRPARPGVVELHVGVSAAPWAPVSRYRVLRDGEVVLERAISRGQAEDVSIDVFGDAFVVVLVTGDDPLRAAAGEPATPMLSTAFTNPIFIDADGDGLWTPRLSASADGA